MTVPTNGQPVRSDEPATRPERWWTDVAATAAYLRERGDHNVHAVALGVIRGTYTLGLEEAALAVATVLAAVDIVTAERRDRL